ncbi:YbhB/YbcL family Raf kinase inhibitor-like protein [Natrinema longum]|uniref:YbhB/YbcL family Raf kinase inhibitor-like protein n=1 Tax=Natrinema longum TaxID=370324 RepID=A0A8A2UBG4_9EURY|nr:YbhB/YbcL family Raf kinase inhibitor-like protein [Natrinema longum]MBZ6496249.1 YbhB/YbcL family Raf kinase inhibitor-like protein [Natrinema longum]QSW85832.1 YbhB/YbcL family Raf kinase inhibitor-like protein [Natrinema longum]
MGDLTLESQAFDDGQRIPEEYGYTETNVNPPLEIRGVPDDAATLALIVDDPDAIEPAGNVWDHWIVWNVPPETGTIPEDWDAADAIEGTNDYGDRGYGGPNPPDREHTYRFRLFALEMSIDLGPDAAAADLESAIEGHVLEQARLEGTYPA